MSAISIVKGFTLAPLYSAIAHSLQILEDPFSALKGINGDSISAFFRNPSSLESVRDGMSGLAGRVVALPITLSDVVKTEWKPLLLTGAFFGLSESVVAHFSRFFPESTSFSLLRKIATLAVVGGGVMMNDASFDAPKLVQTVIQVYAVALGIRGIQLALRAVDKALDFTAYVPFDTPLPSVETKIDTPTNKSTPPSPKKEQPPKEAEVTPPSEGPNGSPSETTGGETSDIGE